MSHNHHFLCFQNLSVIIQFLFLNVQIDERSTCDSLYTFGQHLVSKDLKKKKKKKGFELHNPNSKSLNYSLTCPHIKPNITSLKPLINSNDLSIRLTQHRAIKNNCYNCPLSANKITN